MFSKCRGQNRYRPSRRDHSFRPRLGARGHHCADKLTTFWRPWFTNPAQRCLIPITAFAEAEGEKGRMTRTWLSITDQPLAACAGLWHPTDEWGDCYTMVMVDATEELFDIHDRMPAILHAADHDV